MAAQSWGPVNVFVQPENDSFEAIATGPIDSLGYRMRRHLIRAEPRNAGDTSEE